MTLKKFIFLAVFSGLLTSTAIVEIALANNEASKTESADAKKEDKKEDKKEALMAIGVFMVLAMPATDKTRWAVALHRRW